MHTRTRPLLWLTCFALTAGTVSANTTNEVFAGNAIALQNAVAAAGPGDVILIGPGSYPLTTTLVIDKPLTLRGTAGPLQTVLDANRQRRVIELRHPDALVEGVTVRRGLANTQGGGVHIQAGIFRNGFIQDSVALVGDGGGAYVFAGRIEDTTFTGNWARDRGGAVYMEGGSVIIRCQFRSNASNLEGGGVYAIDSTIERSEFNANSANRLGGGIAGFGMTIRNGAPHGRAAPARTVQGLVGRFVIPLASACSIS